MRPRHTIQCVKDFCDENGMICDSEIFEGTDNRLKIRCKNCNDAWTPTFANLKNKGSNCPNCFGSKKIGIDKIKEICRNKKITCLNDDYKNYFTKLNFICDICGFPWSSLYAGIEKLKAGCTRCSGRAKYSIEEIKEILLKKNILCLATEYRRKDDKLHCKCLICGYDDWFPRFGHLKNNKSGCPKCYGGIPLEYNDVKKFFNQKGFELINKEYKNIYEPLKIRCFLCKRDKKIQYLSFKRGSQKCKYCFDTTNENKCREILEKIFQHKFIKIRPIWLRLNNDIRIYNNCCELDGYCEELKIAFEYQGQQHYEIDGYYIKTEERLKKLQERDAFKLQKCKENGVTLIVIPHWENKNLEQFILMKLIQNNIYPPYFAPLEHLFNKAELCFA